MKLGILSLAHMHAYSYMDCILNLDCVELAGIADENSDIGKTAADKYGTRYFKSYRDLLADECEGVIITSENANHPTLAIAAAEAGKHIICESPIAATWEGANSLLLALGKNKVKFQMALPYRFSTPVRRAKERVDSGDFGAIRAITGTNCGKMPNGWFTKKKLSGGGAVINNMTDILDLIRWLLSSEVSKLYAEIDTRFQNIEVEDCALVWMEFENGVFATLDPSWSLPKSYSACNNVTLEIVAEKGTLFIDAFKQSVEVYDDSKAAHYSSFWGDNMRMEMIRSFVECVRENKDPAESPVDGLHTLEAALAAYGSARKGSPLSIEEFSGAFHDMA